MDSRDRVPTTATICNDAKRREIGGGTPIVLRDHREAKHGLNCHLPPPPPPTKNYITPATPQPNKHHTPCLRSPQPQPPTDPVPHQHPTQPQPPIYPKIKRPFAHPLSQSLPNSCTAVSSRPISSTLHVGSRGRTCGSGSV